MCVRKCQPEGRGCYYVGVTKHSHTMIDYSITQQMDNPRFNGAPLFVLPQLRGTVTLREFAAHIARHGSAYDAGDIAAILYKIAACLREEILAGYQVDLEDMGLFAPSLRCSGFVHKGRGAETFTDADIHTLTVRWKKSAALTDLRADAELRLVTPRRIQREALRGAGL